MPFCSDVLPSGRRWRNGLEFFRGLELCSALEMLSRSHCWTELEPEQVIAALGNCPSFAKDGRILFLNVSQISLVLRVVGITEPLHLMKRRS